MGKDAEAKKEKQEKKEMSWSSSDIPKKANLGDSATLKRMLDDAAIKVMLDEEKYEEDTGLSNLKLVIGFAGTGASLVSHVYPAPFPRNWWVLLWCCAFYFICSGLLQLLLSFVELESILLVRRKKLPGSRTRPAGGLNVSSHFPRFCSTYTLGITPLPNGSLCLASAPKFRPRDEDEARTDAIAADADGSMQRSWAVNEFFDEDGVFSEAAFEQEVEKFYSSYEAAHPAETKKDK